MRVLTVRAGLSLVLLGGAGCGTIFHGTRQNVPTQSAPDGAGLSVEPGGERYTTPASLSLERRRDYHLTFHKDGYEPAGVDVHHHMTGGILVLDILTGLVGVIVDGATGGWYHLSPRQAQAVLTKTNTAAGGPSTIRVSVSFRKGELLVRSDHLAVEVQVQRR